MIGIEFSFWVLKGLDHFKVILVFFKDDKYHGNSYINESNKLDGENYVNWKFKLSVLMEGYNVWSIACGDEAKPVAPAASVQDWERQETKAKVLLRMSVKDNIIPHITQCKTSHETWETLKGLYETTNTNRVLFLKSKLLSKRWRRMKISLTFFLESKIWKIK